MKPSHNNRSWNTPNRMPALGEDANQVYQLN